MFLLGLLFVIFSSFTEGEVITQGVIANFRWLWFEKMVSHFESYNWEFKHFANEIADATQPQEDALVRTASIFKLRLEQWADLDYDSFLRYHIRLLGIADGSSKSEVVLAAYKHYVVINKQLYVAKSRGIVYKAAQRFFALYQNVVESLFFQYWSKLTFNDEIYSPPKYQSVQGTDVYPLFRLVTPVDGKPDSVLDFPVSSHVLNDTWTNWSLQPTWSHQQETKYYRVFWPSSTKFSSRIDNPPQISTDDREYELVGQNEADLKLGATQAAVFGATSRLAGFKSTAFIAPAPKIYHSWDYKTPEAFLLDFPHLVYNYLLVLNGASLNDHIKYLFLDIVALEFFGQLPQSVQNFCKTMSEGHNIRLAYGTAKDMFYSEIRSHLAYTPRSPLRLGDVLVHENPDNHHRELFLLRSVDEGNLHVPSNSASNKFYGFLGTIGNPKSLEEMFNLYKVKGRFYEWDDTTEVGNVHLKAGTSELYVAKFTGNPSVLNFAFPSTPDAPSDHWEHIGSFESGKFVAYATLNHLLGEYLKAGFNRINIALNQPCHIPAKRVPLFPPTLHMAEFDVHDLSDLSNSEVRSNKSMFKLLENAPTVPQDCNWWDTSASCSYFFVN